MVPAASGALSTVTAGPAGSLWIGQVIPGPTHGQTLGLAVAVACLLTAAIGSAWTSRRRRSSGSWAWVWMAAGLACNVMLLLWRGEQLDWQDWPLKHQFDTFLLLTTLMGLVGLYADLMWHWKLTGTVFTVVTLVLEISVFLGLSDYRFAPGPQPAGPAYHVHVAAFVAAAVCLGVAGVAGGTYLALDRRLRRPGGLMTAGHYPSLEALERLNLRAATLGFPLLTVGLGLGLLQVRNQPDFVAWLLDPKVASALVVWLVYAMLLHLRRIPTFRGTRTAWMSMLCTLGLLVTFVISNLMVTKHP